MSKPSARDLHDYTTGKLRPNEFHWKVQGKACTLCGKQAVMTARVFAPADGIPKEHLLVMAMGHPGGKIPVAQTKFGEAAACLGHRTDLERESAKHPDSWFVEFDYGPDANNSLSVRV